MERRRTGKLRRGPVIAVIAAALLGGVAGGLIVNALSSDGDGTPAACSATSVAERDLPSVVTIRVAGAGRQGTGSGTILDSEGHVLTNNHVIAAAASGGHVEVIFNDGEEVSATIKGRDASTDVAVVKIPGSEAMQPISLGETSEVRFGAPVVALGAPLGLSNTVTSGIVSTLERTVSVP